MQPLTITAAFFAGVLGMAYGSRAAAQAAVPVRAATVASAAVGRDWLDVRFPALALNNTGCMYTSQLPTGETKRWYQWQVTANFADSRYPHNHFMGVYVFFGLPDTVPMTEARLDSALAAARITVDEARGDPPVPGRRIVPVRSWARREGARVRLRVEGRAGVQAFLRARTDSVDVGWCQRDEFLTSVRAPLTRR